MFSNSYLNRKIRNESKKKITGKPGLSLKENDGVIIMRAHEEVSGYWLFYSKTGRSDIHGHLLCKNSEGYLYIWFCALFL